MLLLMLFALIAGAGTAITPCVLPVLPALLSTSATGGRRRPFGVVAGLSITFTITIVALATVIKGVGLADNAVRTIAIAVLLGFGISLLVPALGDRFEAQLSRLARFGPKDRGDGFWSGLGVGAALGFVYAPCAGPILGAVIAGSATTGTTFDTIVIAISYSLGSAAVLLLYAFGSHKLGDRIRRAGRGPTLQRAVGVIMIATALAIATDADVRFQTALANHFPDAIVNPTGGLERSDAVANRLDDLRGRSKFDSERAGATKPNQPKAGRPSNLPVLGEAPDFTGNQRWFNTPGDRALSLKDLKGRVVLVDFWTYTCINCIRTLPYVTSWDRRYRDKGLTVVGVHTPEFSFEKDAGNVADSIKQNKIKYPVAQDNDYATWNAYGNQYWPAKYLIDAKGRVRYTHFGEGDYGKTDGAIRSLLQEARGESLKQAPAVSAQSPSLDVQTPETYLGSDHPDRFLPSNPTPGTHEYRGYAGKLPLNNLALKGKWRIDGESATGLRDASLKLHFGARRVFLVLGPAGRRPGRVELLLDGRPVSAAEAGRDVRAGAVDVKTQRLYSLIELPRVENRVLELRFKPGTAGYAFTFG
jgi:cytochrome c biogenesis protein CcdA/thiol-disulfide isomerase/thioredoxin